MAKYIAGLALQQLVYRSPHYDYTPRTYPRAQVVFVNGLVRQWQMFPEPVN